MTIIAVVIVVLALAILFSTLKASAQICRLSREFGWKILFGLIIGFCCSYTIFAFYLLQQMEVNAVELGLSLILFFGSLFVLLVIQLSVRSLKREQQQTEQQKLLAEQDNLTGLSNRASCLKQIDRRLLQCRPFALLLIDLNNFKEINDALGHSVGDKLLKELSQRLLQSLLPNNQLFRIGGDEFVLLCDQIDSSSIYSQNNVFVSTLHHPFHVEGYELYLTYSAGSSQYSGNSVTSYDLLKEADIAMYHAKHTRQSLVIFSDDLGGEAKRVLHTLQRLQQALARNDLLLHYQPVYDLISSEIVAVEALLRWPQEDGTVLAADQFIKLALRAGILRQITPWVLAKVHQDLPKLIELRPSIRVHINLSAFDLQSNKIVHHLAEHQSKEGTFARHVVLEISDHLMIAYPESEEIIRTLNDLGYQVNIDDFAASGGGIRHLLNRGLSAIKIDPSAFTSVPEPERSKLIELCKTLSSQLGIKLVAKGIEREEQVEHLKTIGFTQMQGFHICEPMSLHNCLNWMNSQYVVSKALRANK